MNILSHLYLSDYLYAKYIYAYLPGRRLSFLFGNIFPDISLSYFIAPHTPALRCDFVLGKIIDSAEYKNLTCFQMGVICHFLSDFFTLPHNRGTKLYSYSHHIYEKILCKKLRKRLKKRPSVFSEFKGGEDFNSYLKTMLDNYINLPMGFETDVSCILKINSLYLTYVIRSIGDAKRSITGSALTAFSRYN